MSAPSSKFTPGHAISFGVSREEYARLLRALDGFAPAVSRALPSPITVEPAQALSGGGKTPSTARVVRANTRLFGKIYFLLMLIANGRVAVQHRSLAVLLQKFTVKDKTNARIAATLAGVSVSYKLVYKLLLALRPYFSGFLTHLKEEERKLPIPEQLWIDSHTFTPLVAGLVSGSLFKLFPREAERDVIAIYALMRAGEFAFNYLDDLGLLSVKPKFFGSWSLFPFAFSQMFHSYFFNPETNPRFVRKALDALTTDFFPARPKGYKSSAPWPSHEQFVDAIAKTAEHNYPKFQSSLMFPATAFPEYLGPVLPVVTRAHPAIGTMTGAIMRPTEPSLFRNLMEVTLKKYGHIGKYVFALYLIQGFVLESKHKKQTSKVKLFLQSVAKSVRTTSFIVLTIVSAFAGIEHAQAFYGNAFLSKHRFKFIGFVAGLWAFIDQAGGSRGRYIFAARAALLSYWRVLIKDKRVRATRNTDAYAFAVAFAVMMALFDRSPESVSGAFVRKVLAWIRHDEFKDPVKTIE